MEPTKKFGQDGSDSSEQAGEVASDSTRANVAGKRMLYTSFGYLIDPLRPAPSEQPKPVQPPLTPTDTVPEPIEVPKPEPEVEPKPEPLPKQAVQDSVSETRETPKPTESEKSRFGDDKADPLPRVGQIFTRHGIFNPGDNTKTKSQNKKTLAKPLKAKKTRRRKKYPVLALALILIVAAGGLYVVLYMPNTPDNVYSTGMARSGAVYESVLKSALQKDKLAIAKQGEVSGRFDLVTPTKTYKGTFESKYNPNVSDTNINLGSDANSLALELLTSSHNGANMESYIKLSGLSDSTLGALIPVVVQKYDNRWFSITSEDRNALPGVSSQQPPVEDSAELALAAWPASRAYVFTNDPSKSLLVNRNYIGTEKIDGSISSNRYLVSINSPNIQGYCSSMIEAMHKTGAFNRLAGARGTKPDELQDSMIKDCRDTINTAKNTKTFEVWIDKKLKIIRKIRISSREDRNNYVEIGQAYVAGKNVPTYFNVSSQEYSGSLHLDTNLEGTTVDGKFTAEYKSTNKVAVNAVFQVKPSSIDFTVEKPKQTTPLQELLKLLNPN